MYSQRTAVTAGFCIGGVTSPQLGRSNSCFAVINCGRHSVSGKSTKHALVDGAAPNSIAVNIDRIADSLVHLEIETTLDGDFTKKLTAASLIQCLLFSCFKFYNTYKSMTTNRNLY
jgi:hypothetical protein